MENPKLPFTKPFRGEDVVISGMSGAFPNSRNIYHFRDNLLNKVNLTSCTGSRWKTTNPEVPKRSGKLINIRSFDAGYFGITSVQANSTDTMCRLALEKVIEAIMDAGYNPSELAGTKTGVFAANCDSESETVIYYQLTGDERDPFMGTMRSMLAKRVSHFLKLDNTAFIMDSACSTGLHVMAHAFRQIRDGKCDKAIVLGTQLNLSQTIFVQFTRMGAISADGVCRTFDINRSGYGRSEATAAFLLEKPRDARRIYAEIIHMKTNNDGFKQEGISFPSVEGQKSILSEFYNEINMNPGEVTFVEAHGTGTKAGDPVELTALYEVCCKNRKRKPLYVGAVKSNMGHSESTAAYCGIIKVLLCMETGVMMPNINFETPCEELIDGEIAVVTDAVPFLDEHGLVAVNSFGFGGANAHTLLRWNPKVKINNGQAKDNIPRLVCVSGRTAPGVTDILDDFKTRNCDSEYAFLIQKLYSQSFDQYVYRGYGIYTKQDEVKRSFRKLHNNTEKLLLIFSDFNKRWSKLCHHLMEFPSFARTTKEIHEILCNNVNIDFPDIFTNAKQVTSISEILIAVSTQIALANILKDMKIEAHRIIGIGTGELIAAYMDNYLTLKQTVVALFYIISNMNQDGKINWELLERIVPARANACEKWTPIDTAKFCASPSKYFASNIMTPADRICNGRSASKHELPLFVGSNAGNIWKDAVTLVDAKSQNPIVDFLSNLGSLYERGVDMEVDKVYPTIELPVSRGTPMISPLIGWDHRKDYLLPYIDEIGVEKRSFITTAQVSLGNEDWSFINGHVVDGRDLFPAAGYLYLVWQAFTEKAAIQTSSVVFEDVSFLRATSMPKEKHVNFEVAIQTGTNHFTVEESGTLVAKGKIYNMSEENAFTDISTKECDEDSMCLDTKDIYKELRLRGYDYKGEFRKVKKCNVDGTRAVIEWTGHWISFLDNLMQTIILQEDSRTLWVPIAVQQMKIDAPKCLEEISRCNNMVPVQLHKELEVVRAEGVEMRTLIPKAISKRKVVEPVLEYSKFVANEALCKTADSIRIFAQVILENTGVSTIKAVEVPPVNNDDVEELLCPLIHRILEDLPAINYDLKILTTAPMEAADIQVQDTPLAAETNCVIVVVSDVLRTQKISTVLNAIQGAKGFVISREDTKADPSKFIGSSFCVLCTHRSSKETLFLLRQTENSSRKTCYLDMSGGTDSFEWLDQLQNYIKHGYKVVLYAQNEELTGLLGLTTCLLREQSSSKISCFLMMDQAPRFNPDLDFYKEQLNKCMAVNVWEDGTWGTYKYLLVRDNQSIETEHCYANTVTIGDLSTLTWLTGNLSKSEKLPPETELVDIYYSALNFRDWMVASARLSPHLLTKDRIQQQCVQGLEFSGRDSRGRRVMGLCGNGAMASMVTTGRDKLFLVPDDWTMEDAATACVVYMTAIQALVVDRKLTPGQTILIHSGTGGVGQAAINLSIHYGLTIFVTVGTPEKRQFIKEHYPQIKEEHIGNSRDTSFEMMIYKYTNGRGVDYVLNSLAEEKLFASVRCLAKGGKFLEIGKYDLSNNAMLAMSLLEKEADFLGITLDKLVERTTVGNLAFATMFEDLLNCGAIKPITRKVFKMDELEAAFRFISTGKHIGKLLLKIRDEEDEKIVPVPKTLFKAKPRFICNPEHSYVVCGGLGGFGLELADFLILRGAKNLILTSKSGITNGYQQYRLRTWRSYGVNVLTTTCCASTEKGCRQLLEAAIELAPVGGIFNLGVVLKDALIENQTVESFETSMIPKAYTTKFLDIVSRQLCPNLRYFVVFSSLSCGRGNTGQTNYGMANSIMERICEKRKREGYHALAVQWGAVGDVGLVAKMKEDNRELVICGTLQQRIENCLEVLDKFLMQTETIVSSMVVAEKRYGSGTDLYEDIVNIIGITNTKTVSMFATLPELGVDSMMAVEIKQTLERDYEIFLTPQEIRALTLAKLKKMSIETITEDVADKRIDNEQLVRLEVLEQFIGDETLWKVPVIKMRTLVEDGEDAPHVIALPGLEGTATILEGLCKKLRAHVLCVQFRSDLHTKSISDTAHSVLAYIQSTAGDLILLAHSYGCVVTTEILRILELNNRQARAIYIDGSPELLRQYVGSTLPVEDDHLLQVAICLYTMKMFSSKDILKCKDGITALATMSEKVDYMVNHTDQMQYSHAYLKEKVLAMFDRTKALHQYQFEGPKLNSKITLFKATLGIMVNPSPDYGLSKHFAKPIDIVSIKGGHVDMLENQDLPDHINEMFKTL